MNGGKSESEKLAACVCLGDEKGARALLSHYENRLKRMVKVRMDPRLVRRVDPSDVVQEALVSALLRLPGYIRQPALPIYPWLRQIAWERLVDLYHHHISRQKRSINRERCGMLDLPDGSAVILMQALMADTTSPSQHAVREEMRQRVNLALGELDENDREILILRHLEQMKISEIAAMLNISESAVKMRRLRAVVRLRTLLGDDFREDG